VLDQDDGHGRGRAERVGVEHPAAGRGAVQEQRQLLGVGGATVL
jgi:hypothetical protein